MLGPELVWMADGFCVSSDPEAWFPPSGVSTRHAKAVCNGSAARPACPVRARCLDYALANDDRFGVWGGKSERERRKLKRRAVPGVDTGNSCG